MPEASTGFYRAAVIHRSPGLQPWVDRTERHALKVAADVACFGLDGGSMVGARVWQGFWNQYANVLNASLGRRFQGICSELRNPGLKPWAILFPPFGGTATNETAVNR